MAETTGNHPFRPVEPPLGLDVKRQEPIIVYQFRVEFGQGDAQFVAYATEVGGLEVERDILEHKFVNQNFEAVTQMVPGRIKWQPVTLKQLMTGDPALWDWFMDNEGPSLNVDKAQGYAKARLPVTITAFHRDHSPAITWELSNAWPSKVSGPQFDSASGDFGFEEVTLVYETIRRSTVGAPSGSTAAGALGGG